MSVDRKSQRITQERLREVLSYDAVTGLFSWRISRGKASTGKVAGKLRDTGRIIGIDGETMSAARLAWFYVHGEWPRGLLRFKDGNRDNTAISNLFEGRFHFTTKEGKNAYMKHWRSENPRSQRHLILKSKYGMSIEDYVAMIETQKGVCACCGKPETAIQHGVLLPLSVDHDHADGSVRGLLCVRCNHMLGHAFDNPDILRAAAAYLEAHTAKPKTNVIPLAGRRIGQS